MQKLENFIHSVKYLPSVLYFGSIGLLMYDNYFYVINKKEFLNVYIETLLIIIFCIMTYLGVKKYQKKL